MAAVAMPLVMRAPWVALDKALAIPSVAVERLPGVKWLASRIPQRAVVVAQPQTAQITVMQHVSRPKPSPAHVAGLGAEGSEDPVSVTVQRSPEDLQASITELTAAPTKSSASAAIASVMQTVSPAVREPASFWNWERVRSVAISVYFGVLALLLIRMVAGLGMALRIWHRARPTRVPGLAAAARIRVSRDLHSPVTIGSTVLLPADYADWDEDKLRMVLAHEQSHVRQGDFYLQLGAALYATAFWFSPLGWWLQRRISELGEALSDRAGLEQAKDAASYAQILLEFAALPRTSPLTGALTGVAMARSSNLSGRIERILNDRRFRLAFLGGRRHAVLTAVLVPAALVATLACIQIVPSVEAAQAAKPAPVPSVPAVAPQAAVVPDGVATAEPAVVPDTAPQAAVVPDAAPLAPPAPEAAESVAPEAPDTAQAEADDKAQDESRSESRSESHTVTRSYGHRDNHGDMESFAIVKGGHSNVTISDGDENGLEQAKAKYHDNFIWFKRGGKSYVITDPAILAQAETMFATDPKIRVKQKELEQKQKALQDEMQAVTPMSLKIDLNTPEFKHSMDELQLRLKDLDKIKIDVNTPEFRTQMVKMQLDLKKMQDEKLELNMHEFQEQMGKLQGDLGRIDAMKIKAMTAKINAEVQAQVNAELKADVQAHLQEQLGDLQGSIGDIQGQMGEIQGLIGEQQGRLGEKQGEIGERMGKVGEQMGRLGEEQGKQAERAVRQMRSVLDQAVRDGKAKPVE
jgi:beta-lactamase regulating signal transducer with metallopeptidase domain